MVIHINFKDSAFTAVNQDVKGVPLSIEGIQKGYLLQGSKKLSSSNPGQVDFLAGQVTFEAHLANE